MIKDLISVLSSLKVVVTSILSPVIQQSPTFLAPGTTLLLLLLSHFSRVRLCAIPQMAAHQAPPSLGFSRQEHWSGSPFPCPVHEKGKWSHSVVSDSSRPHGLQPTRLLRPWDFPGKSTGVGCHCLLQLGTTLVEYNFSTDLCSRMVSGVLLGAHNLDCLHVKFTVAFVLLWESNATADLPAGEAQVEMQVIWSGYKHRRSFDCFQPLTSRCATDCYQSMIWGLGPLL